MSEKPQAGPLDPVAVREARKRIVEAIDADGPHGGNVWFADYDDIALILALLDEGREASAPFAAEVDGYHNIAGGDIAMFVGVGALRRLAAFHALFPEPEEKNDGQT